MTGGATTRDPAEVDVAICGYGPVGAVLANLLGQAGHTVAVFERAPSVYHLPRAAHFDHEIMRVFQSIGLADQVLGATAAMDGMDFLSAQGDVLLRFDRTSSSNDDGWAASYMFYQPDLERILREGVARFADVAVNLEHEVVDVRVDPHGGGAIVSVRDLRSNEDRAVPARFVVGCDGARSLVRHAIDAQVDDTDFDESWVVVDVALDRPVPLPTVCQQICDPARPTTFVPMPEPHRRWEFMLLDGESPEEMERPDRVWELLAPWVGPEDGRIVRAVVYTFHALVARGWRRGPILLAGDAAHQMPPFLGQGMCAGIRDVATLAWRLHLVLRGAATDGLLDSYEAERAPHVQAITRLAVHLGSIICTTDPEVAAARDQAMLADQSQDRPTAMPGLSSGLLSATGGPAGSLFPQAFVEVDGARRRLDDVIGSRFALIARVLPGPELSAPGEPEIECVAAHDVDGALARWFDEHDCDVVLVRPDRYVFGAGTDPYALLDELRGNPTLEGAISTQFVGVGGE